MHPGQDPATHTRRPLAVDFEGEQVALVDPDQPGPDAQGPLELGLVVDLHESVQAQLRGEPEQARASSSRLQGGDDEQHGVGAHEAGVADVGGRTR